MRVAGRFLVAVIGTMGIASTAPAQVTFRTTGLEFGDMVNDVVYLWGSPFRASGESWASTLVTGAAFAGLLTVDDQVDAWIVAHPRSAPVLAVEPFREKHKEAARLVTARRLVPISGALILGGMASGTRGLREAGYGCLSGWAMSNTLRYAIYAGVARERPSSAKGDQYRFAYPGGDWDQHSFFGGHAMNAFACVTFWNERFDMGVLEPVLYAAATASSLARMADRRHWASDTFLGMVIGYATGRTVANRYERRELRREARRGDSPLRTSLFEAARQARLAPTAGGAALYWELSF